MREKKNIMCHPRPKECLHIYLMYSSVGDLFLQAAEASQAPKIENTLNAARAGALHLIYFYKKKKKNCASK